MKSASQFFVLVGGKPRGLPESKRLILWNNELGAPEALSLRIAAVFRGPAAGLAIWRQIVRLAKRRNIPVYGEEARLSAAEIKAQIRKIARRPGRKKSVRSVRKKKSLRMPRTVSSIREAARPSLHQVKVVASQLELREELRMLRRRVRRLGKEKTP